MEPLRLLALQDSEEPMFSPSPPAHQPLVSPGVQTGFRTRLHLTSGRTFPKKLGGFFCHLQQLRPWKSMHWGPSWEGGDRVNLRAGGGGERP